MSAARSSGLRSLPRNQTLPAEQRLFSSRCSSSWCRRCRRFSSATSAVSSAVCASRSFRLSISCERKSSTVSRSIASFERNGPEDALRLGLAAGRSLGERLGQLLAGLGELDVNVDVAIDDLSTVDDRPALKVFMSRRLYVGCGCQNPASDLGVKPC